MNKDSLYLLNTYVHMQFVLYHNRKFRQYFWRLPVAGRWRKVCLTSIYYSLACFLYLLFLLFTHISYMAAYSGEIIMIIHYHSSYVYKITQLE